MQFLPLRFGDGNIDALFDTAIVPDMRNRSPEQIAQFILERLDLAKEGNLPLISMRANAPIGARPPTSEDILALQERVKQIRVDRDEEKQLFRAIVTKQSPVRALFIEAESGMGKSNLLDDFVQTDVPFFHALVDFKNASFTFGDVLFSIRSQLGADNFQTFDTVCRDTLRRANAPELRALLPSQVDGVLLRTPGDESSQS